MGLCVFDKPIQSRYSHSIVAAEDGLIAMTLRRGMRRCCASQGAGSNILCLWITGIFLFAAITFAVLPGAAQAQSFRFNAVEVEGNQRIDTSTALVFDQSRVTPASSANTCSVKVSGPVTAPSRTGSDSVPAPAPDPANAGSGTAGSACRPCAVP